MKETILRIVHSWYFVSFNIVTFLGTAWMVTLCWRLPNVQMKKFLGLLDNKTELSVLEL